LQELAHFELEGIAFLRERSGKTMNLFGRRLGVGRTAAGICPTVVPMATSPMRPADRESSAIRSLVCSA